MGLSKRRGDTLVEVAMALALLSVVLVSAFNIASAAFRLGQSAKERTQASNLIQEQAEALRNYRDSNPWGTFEPGTRGTFHMVRNASGGWRPQGGTFSPTLSGLPTLYTLRIVRSTSGGERAPFQITAEWDQDGSTVPNTTTIAYTLVNLDGLAPDDRSFGP